MQSKKRGLSMKKYFKGEKTDFFMGVNYWASHSGINMWKDFSAKVVEEDFKKIANAGLKVVRVFPLWRDFQPITAQVSAVGIIREVTFGDRILNQSDAAEAAGVDIKCVNNFKKLIASAKRHGLKLIVPLLTGFMSGRSYFPPALVNRNVVKDSFCVKWECKFIKYFVNEFKKYPQIIAWELGNECNNLACEVSSDDAYRWTNEIVSTIKSVDDSRPVMSGMHGLCSGYDWNLNTQSENCDVLTTHPYMLFTDFCDYQKLVSIRAIAHAPCETAMYSDLGKKDCFVEEIGTLGNMMGCDKVVAKFARASLFETWAHGSDGFVWWDAFDQKNLPFAPYDWNDLERELGIFTFDGKDKPIAHEFVKFGAFLNSLPFKSLPPRERHAKCLITESDWALGFGSYIIAKMAGMEIEFANKDIFCDGELYILPRNGELNTIKTRTFKPLVEKLKKGATLLVTYGGGSISPCEELLGFKSGGRSIVDALETELNGKKIYANRKYAVDIIPLTCEVLANDKNGKPCFTLNKLGNGNVLFFNAPIEDDLARGEYISVTECNYEEVYKYAMSVAGIKPTVNVDNKNIGVTTHPNEKGCTVVAVNYTDETLKCTFDFDGKIVKTYYGKLDDDKSASLAPAEALVFDIEK